MPRLLLAATWVALLVNLSAVAQQQPDIEAVKAANQGFYAALSARDVSAMQKVWSSDNEIQNIGPRSKTIVVGWDNIKKGFQTTFDLFPELKVSMEPKSKSLDLLHGRVGLSKPRGKTKTV
jgi:ketosteroid isomerase-like protein